MYRILMDVCCLNSYSELLPGKEENIELVIENLITLTLLELFEVAVIEGIRVICLPTSPTRQALCSFQVQAACSEEITRLPENLLEARLEDTISCALLDRFSTVMVN